MDSPGTVEMKLDKAAMISAAQLYVDARFNFKRSTRRLQVTDIKRSLLTADEATDSYSLILQEFEATPKPTRKPRKKEAVEAKPE